jgi:hypothetical protein
LLGVPPDVILGDRELSRLRLHVHERAGRRCVLALQLDYATGDPFDGGIR